MDKMSSIAAHQCCITYQTMTEKYTYLIYMFLRNLIYFKGTCRVSVVALHRKSFFTRVGGRYIDEHDLSDNNPVLHEL